MRFMSRFKTFCLLFSACLIGACSAPSRAVRTLHSSGYTDVKTTGWAPFTCGEDDTFSTGFSATNPQGDRVSGTVCCGLITKSCTVRF